MIEMDGEITPRAFAHNAARDSLSPKGSPLVLKEDECAWARQLIQLSRDDHLDGQEYVVTNVKPIRQDVVARRMEESAAGDKSHDTSFQHATSLVAEQQRPSTSTSTKTTIASDMAKEASPRFVPPPPRHRPYELELDDSRGATSISVAELRSLIISAESRSQHAVPSLQTIDHTTLLSPVVAKGRKKYPRPIPSSRQPVCQAPQASTNSMGNQPSRPHRHDHGRSQSAAFTSGGAEDSSTSSQEHAFQATSRKPSINMLKKKSARAMPNGFTATFIEVPRAATAPNLDAIDSAEDEWQDEELYAKEKSTNIHHSKTMSAPSPVLLSQPGSPVTITEERAARPLSAGTTVTGRSMRDEPDENNSPYPQRISALSPTIPTPSPIPEDSPHQYGLKDSTDTPSPLEVSKMKRRSNGIEIFNVSDPRTRRRLILTRLQEAKSLQSAASFLNGLSNARRRAESRTRQRSTTQSTTVTSFATVSTSTLPLNGAYSTSHLASVHDLAATEISDPDSRPITPKIDDISRTLGHGNKSSGFAYAKALSLVQLKCYRNHERLLRSGNKNYPVECAVCHQDDDQPYYWSCSWCAIRMCNGCRASLRQNGMNGIWEKIREAELGAQCS